MGFTVRLAKLPTRIISLVPSQTELLHYLGVEPIAQTIFCVHPVDKFKSAVKIGGTKKLNLDKIRALKPDLIIGNKEENSQEEIEELKLDFPVWMSDVNTLENAMEMITSLGILLGKKEEPVMLANSISDRFNRLLGTTQTLKGCIYLIWNEPFMAVGSNTFIHDMLGYAGFHNLLAHKDRYPVLAIEELAKLAPEVILLSTEPFPFKKEHQDRIQALCPKSEVRIVDGEMFSWYGSRLLESAGYFKTL